MVKGLTLAALILLSACQTVPKGNFCSTAEPIRLPKAAIATLSFEKQKDVLAHNLKGAKLCGWKP